VIWDVRVTATACVLALGLIVSGCARHRLGTAEAHFSVVGYLPEYRMAAWDDSQGKYLTDLIYFSIEPAPSGGLGQ
jgi:hypothetical protein